MRPYIVRQGEHLLGIASRLGFDPDEVWEHDNNRELREARSSGQVLAPGDVLYVPEVEEAACALEAKTTNAYRAPMPQARLHVRFMNGDEPLANEPYRLFGLRMPIAGETDGDGVLDEEVPAHVGELRLNFPNREDEDMILRLGHFDPQHTRAGVAQRLSAVGARASLQGAEYDLPGRLSRDEEEEAVAEALRRFQAQQGLEETGAEDDTTRQGLEDESRG